MAKAGNYLRPGQDKSRAVSGAIASFRHASGHLGVRSRRAGGHCQPGSDSHRWHPIYPMLGTVGAVIIIAGLGWISHVRIVPTDSAGPAGIYRLQKIGEPVAMTWDEPGRPIIAGPHRNDLVLACLPVPIAVWAMQRHYLAGGSCPGGAEPVVKILGAIQGDEVAVDSGFVAINHVRFPHSQTWRWIVRGGRCRMLLGDHGKSRRVKSGSSVSIIRAAGTPAISGQFRRTMYAACCNPW